MKYTKPNESAIALDIDDIKSMVSGATCVATSEGFGSGEGRMEKALDGAVRALAEDGCDVFAADKAMLQICYTQDKPLMMDEMNVVNDFFEKFTNRSIETKWGVCDVPSLDGGSIAVRMVVVFASAIGVAASVTVLREMLLETERKIKVIVGKDPFRFYGKAENCGKFMEVDSLLNFRGILLNAMFKVTPEEVALLEKVNSHLNDLTDKMHRRTTALYCSMIAHCKDDDWDDDYEVEGSLSCHPDYYDDGESVEGIRVLDNDDYYGSDFAYMICLLGEYQEHQRGIYGRNIESCHIHYNRNHTPEMTDEELGCKYETLNWYGIFGSVSHPEFSHINICHAVKSFLFDHDYTIPDLLRIDDFYVEVKVQVQHFTDQRGRRYREILEENEDSSK